MSVLRLRHRSDEPEAKRNSEGIYADSDGTLKHLGSDGNVSDLGGAGGGSQPVGRNEYTASATVDADGTDTLLSWSLLADTGDELLDLTDPTQPTAVEAGIYAVSANLTSAPMPRTGVLADFAAVQIHIDADDFDWYSTSQVSLDGLPIEEGSSGTEWLPPVTLIAYCPAGGVISLLATLLADGIDPSQISATPITVQRLSGPAS